MVLKICTTKKTNENVSIHIGQKQNAVQLLFICRRERTHSVGTAQNAAGLGVQHFNSYKQCCLLFYYVYQLAIKQVRKRN